MNHAVCVQKRLAEHEEEILQEVALISLLPHNKLGPFIFEYFVYLLSPATRGLASSIHISQLVIDLGAYDSFLPESC